MKFRRIKKWSGGALGQISRAISELQIALERVKVGNGLLITYENGSFTIRCTDYATSAPLAIAGTPGLFKVAALVGWEKASAESEWTQMSIEDMISKNPTRLWTSFADGTDAYPWKALRPTWEYVRGWGEEE